MATLTPLKAIALLIFLGAIVGASYGVSALLGDTATTAAVQAEPLRATLNGTAGHDVTYAIRLNNRDTASHDLAAVVSGLGAEARSATVTAFGGANRTVFVTFPVPANASAGEHRLDVKVLDGNGAALRVREGALRLNVLAGGNGFAAGDSANVVYTGRIAATGNVFSTNDPVLVGQEFARTETFPPVINTRPLPVQTVPRVSVVQGFYEGVLGMVPGESRTVTFGPEKGYGNATVATSETRIVHIPHNETLPLPGTTLSMADFDSYVTSTSQGKASDFHQGDVVTNVRNGQTLRYKITEMTETDVTLKLDVHVGETYTVYDFWPNASTVVAADDANVTFRTEPPVKVGESFTYYPYWPNMSVLTDVNETTLTITHTPQIGLEFQKSAGQFSGPQTYTVTGLTDKDVLESTANSNQLAGKDLTFDILMLDVSKAG